MALIAPRTSIAHRPHWVTVWGPDGPPVPDGDGGYTQPLKALTPPATWAAIRDQDGEAQEHPHAGTVIALQTHLIAMPYHPDLTTACEIVFGTRRFQVLGVTNVEERNVDTVATCREVRP